MLLQRVASSQGRHDPTAQPRAAWHDGQYECGAHLGNNESTPLARAVERWPMTQRGVRLGSVSMGPRPLPYRCLTADRERETLQGPGPGHHEGHRQLPSHTTPHLSRLGRRGTSPHYEYEVRSTLTSMGERTTLSLNVSKPTVQAQRRCLGSAAVAPSHAPSQLSHLAASQSFVFSARYSQTRGTLTGPWRWRSGGPLLNAAQALACLARVGGG